jgi:hypothetical protein
MNKILSSVLVGLLVLLSASCSDGWVDCSELQRQVTEIERERESIPWPSDEFAKSIWEQGKVLDKSSELGCSIYSE